MDNKGGKEIVHAYSQFEKSSYILQTTLKKFKINIRRPVVDIICTRMDIRLL